MSQSPHFDANRDDFSENLTPVVICYDSALARNLISDCMSSAQVGILSREIKGEFRPQVVLGLVVATH